MTRSWVFAVAMALLAGPGMTQDIVKGDAVAGLVSRTAKAEVHLIADPVLNDHRLVLKVVVLNLSGRPQALGPDAVTVTVADKPVAIASRDDLLRHLSGGGDAAEETALSHANAALPVNGQGQTDVTSFNGGMASGTGGVPTSSINRTQRQANPAAAAQLDAVLLKPMMIPPSGADGGQVLTEKLKHKPSDVNVAVTFADETHRFLVKFGR